jgi:hypothetical protein
MPEALMVRTVVRGRYSWAVKMTRVCAAAKRALKRVILN